MNISQRNTFVDLVDNLQLPAKADCILVLRNWDDTLNIARLEAGARLMSTGVSKVMLMLYESDTKAEAVELANLYIFDGINFNLSIFDGINLDRVILVTHKAHSYRAILTFIKQCEGVIRELYCVQVDPSGEVFYREFEKIAEYQNRGDISTYEEGIQYLQWLSTVVKI